MASQLAIEITLEQVNNCIFAGATPANTNWTTFQQQALSYSVGNINLIPEILEFDSSYDEAFLRGLQTGGIPIKFSSWHTFLFSSQSSSIVNLLIQERLRSVKSLFTVQRRAQPNIVVDNGATFFDTSSNGQSTLQNYQYRIGGRYFPAAPVQCSTTTGSAVSNGGAEAYLELQKAVNIVGDYRLSTPANILRWGMQSTSSGVLQEFDFTRSLSGFDENNCPVVPSPGAGNLAGTLGSQCFAAAVSLETSNGIEISGLNAEEQVYFLITSSLIFLFLLLGNLRKLPGLLLLLRLWNVMFITTRCWY